LSDGWAALGVAVWLGILTSISPCPLASNIAAVSYLGRDVGSPWRVLLSGLAYCAGRSLAYVAVGVLVVSSVLSIPSVSFFLQERLNQVLGPLLVVVGLAMLGVGRASWPSWQAGADIRERTARAGLAGAGLLGLLFALSFCPASAGLFFGALIPLATGTHSRIVLPAAYGVGTGLPVLLFAVVVAFGMRQLGRTFRVLAAVEGVARPLTAFTFVAAGVYLTLRHLAGLAI
jgi:cytochrome c biogenesis protein CcdA